MYFGSTMFPSSHTACLGEQEIGLQLVKTVVGGEPAGKFPISDAGGILHGPRRADGHDEVAVFEPGPGDLPVLDEIDVQGCRRRDLDGYTAKFAVALPSMAVAQVKIGLLVHHREIDDGARGHIRQVHVATPIIRLQRRDRLDFRRHAKRPDERLIGKHHPITELHALLGDFIFHHAFWQRRIQQSGG